ncbi:MULTISPECIES: hypothetical protein [Bacillus]|uniref:hypothetical protein n=1 Tax=Bacillus TaxID=1386 RepID=UPI0001A0A73B|nr:MULTISPECIES: hypothetical protein [Bacillus]EEL36829.1 hypothetical protein bcere0020_57930 [Bacillus cereus Rock3-29]KAB0449328.1 hypothetical protein CH334_05305 [Lysinibacillus sp. VIA-II-2016]ARC27686.1 hypothetical protein A6J74_01320 [Bacillus sp. FDAARGOS_235]EJV41838.1 hypothetical protein IEA_05600 [Bacillus toyonensis]EJV42198.1 hypothetical protein IEK_05749 [Bacillus toyonensis]
MFKKFVVSVLTLGFLVMGGISAQAEGLNVPSNNGICKDVTQNVEANEYVKSCFKTFPNPFLGPIISIPNTFTYDDGVYHGTLNLVSQERSKFSIVAYYEGTLKKYK